MALKRLPHTPDWVAGVANYRGTAVLVVDTSLLMIGKPCRTILSTRILLTSVQSQDGAAKILGLMAENVTGTVKILPETQRFSEVWKENAPYLGLFALHEGEILQIIRPGFVFSGESRRLLELEGYE